MFSLLLKRDKLLQSNHIFPAHSQTRNEQETYFRFSPRKREKSLRISMQVLFDVLPDAIKFSAPHAEVK